MDVNQQEIKNGSEEGVQKTITELKTLESEINKLNINLVNLNKSSDRYSKKLIFLTWGLVAFTLILVYLTFILIKDAKNQTSTQNNIALNSAFFNPTNSKIIDSIESDSPILTENKGQFSDGQLNNFLGDFDTIDSSYNEGLLSESDLCDSFSYYVGITNKNKEIQSYITSQQKLDSGFFGGLTDLTRSISNSKNLNCR